MTTQQRAARLCQHQDQMWANFNNYNLAIHNPSQKECTDNLNLIGKTDLSLGYEYLKYHFVKKSLLKG